MAIAHHAAAKPRAKTHARTHPGTIVISAIIALSIAVVLLLLVALWKFWPTEAILAAATPQPVHFLGINRDVSPEIRLFVIVAIAGALGGVMHSTRSVAWYVGHGGLRWRWVPYYFVTIVVGAGLASVFYLVIRGGVFTGKATSADVNPYGFAAIAALVGLFTEEALNMLKRVASQVFAEAEAGADNADQVANASAEADATALAAQAADADAAAAESAEGASAAAAVPAGG